MASGNHFLQLVVAALEIGAAIGAGAFLKNKRLVTMIIIALTLVAYFTGPSVFGRDWYYQGYPAGAVMGFLAGEAVADEIRESDELRSR